MPKARRTSTKMILMYFSTILMEVTEVETALAVERCPANCSEWRMLLWTRPTLRGGAESETWTLQSQLAVRKKAKMQRKVRRQNQKARPAAKEAESQRQKALTTTMKTMRQANLLMWTLTRTQLPWK